jgi:hypothetical protein
VLIDQVAQAMQNQNVGFLNSGGRRTRHTQFDIICFQHASHPTSILPGHGDDAHALFVSRINGMIHIGRVPAGGDREQNILVAA